MNPLDRWKALSTRERLLLVSALAIAAMVIFRYGLLGGEDETESAGADAQWVQVAKIENYRRVLARSEATEQQSGEIQARFQADQDRLTGGATTTQVGAELQGLIGTFAADAGLNVLSSQILKEEEVDGFRRVGVRLTLSGSLEGVARLLSSIEGGEKDLVVAHLEVNRKLGTVRRPTTPHAVPDAATPPPLTVSLEVKTFMRQAT
ncbi:MAG: hypothetical protein HY899_08395 [Deltaproteobacteria bacterium]|nr:hypothetical protein [Deltaproteobacteria bacterium]